MLQSTHQRIAMRLVDAWDEAMRSICSVDQFVVGSTLPDRFLPLRMIPHNASGSGPIVRSLLTALLTKNLSPEAFGRRLGIVCHFLADYACAYHSNKRLAGRILSHRAYEQKIDRLALPQQSADSTIRSLSTLWEDLDRYFATRHSQTSFEDPIQDLEDAMNFTARVTNLVFAAVTDSILAHPVCDLSSCSASAATVRHA